MNRIPKLPGIYIIRNRVNGKEYVGQATNLANRWQRHKHDFASGTHDNPHLVNSWRKYGKENFEFLPLIICERAELTRYEQELLNRRKCAYNLCWVAVQSCRGIKHTPEQIEHQRAIWHDSEFRAKHGWKPWVEKGPSVAKQSPEYREKQRIAQLARFAKRTLEEKAAWPKKVSAAMRKPENRARVLAAQAVGAMARKGHASWNKGTGKVRRPAAERTRCISVLAKMPQYWINPGARQMDWRYIPHSPECRERMAASQRVRRAREKSEEGAIVDT